MNHNRIPFVIAYTHNYQSLFKNSALFLQTASLTKSGNNICYNSPWYGSSYRISFTWGTMKAIIQIIYFITYWTSLNILNKLSLQFMILKFLAFIISENSTFHITGGASRNIPWV